MIQLKLDTKGFDRDMDKFVKKNNKQFVGAVRTSTFKMHFLAVNRAPTRTGASGLRGGIRFLITGKGLTGDVISQKNYSQAVEEGTKPHTITVKSKKVLAGPASKAPPGWGNISGDYAIYGKSVKHPGTRPQPFMMPSFMTAHRLLLKLIGQAL